MSVRPGTFCRMGIGVLIVTTLAFGQSVPSKSTPKISSTSPASLKLLFSDAQDVFATWGQLKFGVTPVGLLRTCDPAPFTIVGCVPLPDGSWEVFGRDHARPGDSSMRVIEVKGNEPYDRIVQWKLMRATTRDGITFQNVEAVHEVEPAAWAPNFSMAYHPERKEYLFMNLKCDRSGFAYTAFFSQDGRRWTQHSQPLFYEGDAFSLFYSPVLKRYVCVSKSLQSYRKRFLDHGGTTPSLNDTGLRDRRVLMFRTSVDGRTWEPNVSLGDVWNRHGKKGAIPEQYLTQPDAQDPPDLEFYSGNGFWYHDRAYLMVLNYAASALAPHKHGPQLDNEWWTSHDGLHWERPARGMNALEVFPRLNRIEVLPLVAEGSIRFRVGNLLVGLPVDRLSYVSSRTNAEFSTRPFVMPEGELRLNAAIPATDRPFAANQGYVIASLVDEGGKVIPGFEGEKCVLKNQDRIDLPLTWTGSSTRSLAGRTVRLRFLLRSANIYAVTSVPATSP